MKQTTLCLFVITLISGFAYAAAETATVPLAVAFPQPSTILICGLGAAFFRVVSKRVP